MIRPILIVVLGAQMVLAQKYKPDDPVPAGAKGKILDIKGLESGVSGKIQDLNAALKDLGAKVTGTEIRIELSADVLFDFDKADLLPKAIPELEKVATVLKSYPNGQCTIDGYTDGKGLKDYNQKLSERRAASVKTW
jgi:outer membrane protein OmpA-like peptidoglycan-associated protein